ncbi:PREDICTED: zinc finger HIT domain-containing protein 3 [Pseudopodoces humilis]|uniref:zinc finger HIT domain-containing protein 3 n=1 Tax=Pseudopodoces humilis TaxID=181119 RepID=UPI0003955889|nr:PREDICTED: zinc finger HIT domain-containing protein 3 [Pseudopodoces humilis]
MRVPGPCAECGAGDAARYRCPRCGSAYCSVPCCRTHRERCAAEPRQEREAAGQEPPPGPAQSPWALEDILGEEDEQDRVPLQKLQLLGESAELRDLLRNPHLRQLLLTLNQARDKSSLLRKLMQEPLFVEFADCCLSIVEPPEEKENVLPD